jgi:hypothetical protein
VNLAELAVMIVPNKRSPLAPEIAKDGVATKIAIRELSRIALSK